MLRRTESLAYNRYNSKRLVLLKNTEPGIFESVRALLEKNQPSTSIHLAFLSCSRGDAFRKRRRFMSHRQLAENRLQESSSVMKLKNILAQEQNWESQRITWNSHSPVCDRIPSLNNPKCYRDLWKVDICNRFSYLGRSVSLFFLPVTVAPQRPRRMIHESLVVWISILVVFSTTWIYLVHCLDSSRFLKSLSSRIMSCTSYYLPSLLLSTISIHSWQLANVVMNKQNSMRYIQHYLLGWTIPGILSIILPLHVFLHPGR